MLCCSSSQQGSGQALKHKPQCPAEKPPLAKTPPPAGLLSPSSARKNLRSTRSTAEKPQFSSQQKNSRSPAHKAQSSSAQRSTSSSALKTQSSSAQKSTRTERPQSSQLSISTAAKKTTHGSQIPANIPGPPKKRKILEIDFSKMEDLPPRNYDFMCELRYQNSKGRLALRPLPEMPVLNLPILPPIPIDLLFARKILDRRVTW